MSEEYKENLDAEVQDSEDSVNTDQEDTLNESNDSVSSDGSESSEEKYLNAKRRAEIAEAKLKELKNSSEKNSGTEEKTVEKTGLSREEAILFAQGMSEEEVNKADKIAKLEGITLLEAKDNELFKAWKQSKDNRVKSEQSQLGASHGSKKTPEKKDFSSPGLSAEDHKELFRQRMNK